MGEFYQPAHTDFNEQSFPLLKRTSIGLPCDRETQSVNGFGRSENNNGLDFDLTGLDAPLNFPFDDTETNPDGFGTEFPTRDYKAPVY